MFLSRSARLSRPPVSEYEALFGELRAPIKYCYKSTRNDKPVYVGEAKNLMAFLQDSPEVCQARGPKLPIEMMLSRGRGSGRGGLRVFGLRLCTRRCGRAPSFVFGFCLGPSEVSIEAFLSF